MVRSWKPIARGSRGLKLEGCSQEGHVVRRSVVMINYISPNVGRRSGGSHVG